MNLSKIRYFGFFLPNSTGNSGWSPKKKLYISVINKIIKKINGEEIKSKKQDESKATYSIWRSPDDCLIDWNQSSKNIYNLVRAVSNPYPGAFTHYQGRKIKINKSEILEDKIFEIRDVGKIWSIRDNCPEVICGSGMIKILDASYDDNSKVIFNKLRCRLI